MIGFDLDSQAADAMILRDLTNSNRWSIITGSAIQNNKPIQIIWHPSTIVYRYIKNHYDKLYQYWGRKNGGQYFHLFKIFKPHIQPLGVGHDNVKTLWFQRDVPTVFDDVNKTITLNWQPHYLHLHNSSVNHSITGLTAQRVVICLHIPFLEGLVLRTKGSMRWRRRHHFDSGYAQPWPFFHTFYIRGYVSSNRGFYNRADSPTKEGRVICPIEGWKASRSDHYNNSNIGRRTIMIDDLTEGEGITTLRTECKTWRRFLKRNQGFSLRIDEDHNDQIVRTGDNAPLYDNQTQAIVTADMSIKFNGYYHIG